MKRVIRATALVLFGMAATGCGNPEPPVQAEKSPSASPSKPQVQLLPPTQIADWCKEHGVPESVCTRCNTSLIADFKAKGDWCNEHGLPESQCIACHPELKATFEAMAPKQGGM